MHWKFVVILLLLCAIPALADQVILKNGDRLTGSITKSDGKVLVIKTDYAGDVTVKFDAIQSITSTGDLTVSLAGKTVVGPVTTSGDGSEVGMTWDATKADNPHIKFHSNRRGYVACTATPAQMRADFKVVDKVTVADQPVRVAGALVVEAGRPGSYTD